MTCSQWRLARALGGLAAVLLAAGQETLGDPGTILVIGEKPLRMDFTIPKGAPYRVSFPADKLAVFTAPTFNLTYWNWIQYPNGQLTPGTSYVVGQNLFGDANGDGEVRLNDLIKIRNNRNTSQAECDLDGSGWVDEEDIVAARLALGTGGDTLTLYVAGLAASAALGDVTLEVLTDPDEDGVFAVAETVPITVMSVLVSGQHDCGGWPCGSLGSIATVTISPAISPLTFGTSTTATWEGKLYSDPLLDSWGDPIYIAPEPQQIVTTFNSSQIHESSSSQASFILGDGSKTSGRIGGVVSSGWIYGPLKLHFGAYTLSRTIDFYTALDWYLVAGGGGVGEIQELYAVVTANDPYWHSTLEECTISQYVLAFLAEKNAFSEAIAPPAIPVTLVTYGPDYQPISKQTIWTFRADREDFGPNTIVYYSNWRKPIVFVGDFVDPAQHPELTIVRHAPEGAYGGFYITLP